MTISEVNNMKDNMQQCELCETEFETECPECAKVFGPIRERKIAYDIVNDCEVDLEDLQAEHDETRAMWREMR